MKEFKTEKKLNKILIGAILGTTLLWIGAATMTPKGREVSKSTFQKFKDFLKWWVKELKKTAGETALKKGKKWTEKIDE